jgi:hypothetical protein
MCPIFNPYEVEQRVFKICRTSCNNNNNNKMSSKRWGYSDDSKKSRTISTQGKTKMWTNIGAWPEFEPIVAVFEWLANNEIGSYCLPSRPTGTRKFHANRRCGGGGGSNPWGVLAKPGRRIPFCECVIQFACAATLNMRVQPTGFPTTFHCRGKPVFDAHGIWVNGEEGNLLSIPGIEPRFHCHPDLYWLVLKITDIRYEMKWTDTSPLYVDFLHLCRDIVPPSLPPSWAPFCEGVLVV